MGVFTFEAKKKLFLFAKNPVGRGTEHLIMQLIMQLARWAHMHHFPSVCLSVCLSGVDQKSDWEKIHISQSIY